MKRILIVNGENYWHDILNEFEVSRIKIQESSWLKKDGILYVADKEKVVQPDGILWRIGAIRPAEIQTTALNLIELSETPCVNPASTLKIGYDRLGMLARIKKHKLPCIKFNVASNSNHLKNIEIEYPFVVKVGNYHGGFGKALIENDKKWQDVKDILFTSSTYITIEPYIPYARDIRYIGIRDQIWAMSRKGKYWKANIQTTSYEQIEPEKEIIAGFKELQKDIGADLLAIDILEEKNGDVHIVEYNDIPGLSGFTDDLKYELANVLREKIAKTTE
ncbi:MAG: ATP-grasp domain-containing protein [Bacteroidota bacterium]